MRFDGWDDELYHHGIPKQRWGIRRFQNEDGSLTPEGRKRYLKNGGEKDALNFRGRRAVKRLSRSFSSEKRKDADTLKSLYGRKKTAVETENRENKTPFGQRAGLKTSANKRAREMSKEELKEAIEKLRLEREYSQIYTEQNRTLISAGTKVVSDALKNAATQTLTSAFTSIFGSGINKLFGRKIAEKEMGEPLSAVEKYMKALKTDLERVQTENSYTRALNDRKQMAEKETAEAKRKEPKFVEFGPKIKNRDTGSKAKQYNPTNVGSRKKQAFDIAKQVIEEDDAVSRLKKKGYRYGRYTGQ